MSTGHAQLRKVIDGGYCVGCGLCAAVSSGSIKMSFNEHGYYQAVLPDDPGTKDNWELAARLCPFSGQGLNEDELSDILFSEGTVYDSRIGRHCGVYAGHVDEGSFRQQGSSGGMGTWIATELLKEGLVDAVCHVGARDPSGHGRELFAFRISRSVEEIGASAKSRYFSVELSQVLRQIRENPGRYALVGVPCFVKAVQSLRQELPEFEKAICYSISLFCGHMKSAGFAESLAWQSGVEPQGIASIDFRHKLPDRPAGQYAVAVSAKNRSISDTEVRPMSDMIDRDWGIGAFRLSACEFCDDIVGETADVSVGDAWLPQYVGDSQGTNVVVVRNLTLLNLIERAREEGRLSLDVIDADLAARSQESGLRHRRDGLAYRLWLKQRDGHWFPPKRVQPGDRHLSQRYKKLFRMRQELSELSHQAFAQARETNDLGHYLKAMQSQIHAYRAVHNPWHRQFLFRAQRKLRRLLSPVKRPIARLVRGKDRKAAAAKQARVSQ